MFFHILLAILIVLFASLCLHDRVLLFSLLGLSITFMRALSLISKAFLQLSSNQIFLFSLCVFPKILSAVSLITCATFYQVLFMPASWFISCISLFSLSWYNLITFVFTISLLILFFPAFIFCFSTKTLKCTLHFTRKLCLQVRDLFGSYPTTWWYQCLLIDICMWKHCATYDHIFVWCKWNKHTTIFIYFSM